MAAPPPDLLTDSVPAAPTGLADGGFPGGLPGGRAPDPGGVAGRATGLTAMGFSAGGRRNPLRGKKAGTPAVGTTERGLISAEQPAAVTVHAAKKHVGGMWEERHVGGEACGRRGMWEERHVGGGEACGRRGMWEEERHVGGGEACGRRGMWEEERHLVSYGQLATALKEAAGSTDQKKRQQLVALVFPKLAVYNSVDPSLATALLLLLQGSSDVVVLRYCYYFLARILTESANAGSYNEGGGVPTPNWDTLADVSADGSQAATRAELLSLILSRLATEASTPDVAVHARRMAALKALACAPMAHQDAYAALVRIILAILDSVTEDRKKRRRWRELLRRGAKAKDAALRGNLFGAALSALRRLPLDPASDAFVERVVLGIGCGDAVGLRHALSMAADIALVNPLALATSISRLAGGSLAAAIRAPDMFARVYLARLCAALVHASQIYDRADFRGLFSAFLFQLLYDANVRVCLEAICCITATFSAKVEPTTAQRADGWQILTTSLMDTRGAARDLAGGKAGGSKEKEAMPLPPSYDLVLKVVAHRVDYALRSTSRPMLHAALRAVAEVGKARAAALSLGLFTEAPQLPQDDAADFQQAMGKQAAPKEKVTVDSLLAALMEAVRCTVACECVYVRAQALKAMIWMQSEYESSAELKATLLGELDDPAWPAALLNDLLLTLHARFKATPDMAVTILDLASLFVTRVPSKVDTTTLQALWKTCLVGCGPQGKHLALEAVSTVLDLPPPPPPQLPSSHGAAAVSAAPISHPRSAIALQRITHAAIWFLGENANFAAGEYAWESATPPGAALMLLDAESMVAAAGVRNPTLAQAMQRLQRTATTGAWEDRVVAVYALMTVALRSGEPYRLQIYEFFHALFYGGGSSRKVRGMALGVSNGEDRGASGTGLGGIIAPMLRVLDEMYRCQDVMMRDIRLHEFSGEEWQEEQLERIYDMHERLMDLALLFCFVPRHKYLPLGPMSARLTAQYRARRGMEAGVGRSEAELRATLEGLLRHTGSAPKDAAVFPPLTLLEPLADFPTAGALKVTDMLGGGGDESLSVPATPRRYEGMASAFDAVAGDTGMGSTFDDVYASSLLEADDDAESEVSDGSASPTPSTTAEAFGNIRNWDEESLSGDKGASGASAGQSAAQAGRGRGGEEEEDEGYDYEAELRRRAGDSGAKQRGRALYAFIAGDEDELSLSVGEEVEIEYEADGWYHARKVNPAPDGKQAGFVPVLYLDTR
ncbi:unnamed protein product [Closterium sp. NIES-64]|nr:unnamed protein product [Closterium sp. NIES-64]